MTVDIVVASCTKDIPYLHYCLKSIDKFATGFRNVILVVAEEEEPSFRMYQNQCVLKTYRRVSDSVKWQIHAQAMKCFADTFSDADFILHDDSDCIFTEPVVPEDYFVGGKPVMLIRPFSTLPDSPWRTPTEKALGWPVEFECMARHPQVNPHGLYAVMRRRVEQVYGIPFERYVLSQRGEFPFGFSEHCTLGAYALHDPAWKKQFHWIDTSTQARPKDKLMQFWSHSPPDKHQGTPTGLSLTPLQICQQLGL